MSVYFLLLFASRLGLLCPMGISGDYEETNGRPALSANTHFAIWTNTNLNLDKYKMQFGKNILGD